MERETLLALLLLSLGGLTLQLLACIRTEYPTGPHRGSDERACWFALWWRAMPPLGVTAWLFGWALTQPDPVRTHVGAPIFLIVAPVTVIVCRAVLRAVWAVCRPTDGYLIATVGLLHPRVVVSPRLYAVLDPLALQAALAHERQHQLHLDPLRIWAAQLMTDLQWPWAPAQRRFDDWLAALEQARDDAARALGTDGADLATAVLAVCRLQTAIKLPAATLTGAADALPARIERLLQPMSDGLPVSRISLLWLAGGATLALIALVGAGALFGEHVLGPALAFDF